MRAENHTAEVRDLLQSMLVYLDIRRHFAGDEQLPLVPAFGFVPIRNRAADIAHDRTPFERYMRCRESMTGERMYWPEPDSGTEEGD